MTASIIKSVMCVGILAFFFYRSLWAVLPLSVIGILYFRKTGEELSLADRRTLESQFGEAIRGVATSLRAGYSVENAFIQSGQDMAKQYGRESIIFTEMENIRRGLVLNISLEELLKDLGDRSGCESIRDFAKVFAISKRSGGNMVGAIGNSVDTISLMIETREEMAAALSGRKMEQKIMKIMPFGILSYVGISSPGYFDSLYDNVIGVVIMTGLLIVYLAAYILGDRILKRLEEG